MRPLETNPRQVLLDAIRSEVDSRNFYLRLGDGGSHKTELETEYNALADPDEFISDL